MEVYVRYGGSVRIGTSERSQAGDSSDSNYYYDDDDSNYVVVGTYGSG